MRSVVNINVLVMSSGFVVSAHTNLHIALGSLFTTLATLSVADVLVTSWAITTEVTFIHIKYLQTAKQKQLAIYHIAEVFSHCTPKNLLCQYLGILILLWKCEKAAHFRTFTAQFGGFEGVFLLQKTKNSVDKQVGADLL